MQKKKPKNANRNKALEQAKDNFGKAIDLDPTYIKPVY
jgi:tetratricopeptide (TPR) repeat protein